MNKTLHFAATALILVAAVFLASPVLAAEKGQVCNVGKCELTCDQACGMVCPPECPPCPGPCPDPCMQSCTKMSQTAKTTQTVATTTPVDAAKVCQTESKGCCSGKSTCSSTTKVVEVAQTDPAKK